MQGHELLVEGGGLPVDGSFPSCISGFTVGRFRRGRCWITVLVSGLGAPSSLVIPITVTIRYLRISLGLAGNNLGTFMSALIIVELT